MINQNLARSRGLSLETINKIEGRHDWRDAIERSRALGFLGKEPFDSMWTQNEFELQKLWGFPEDSKYHRFWYSPYCTCPHMDNNDAYPTGYYVINNDCPLHGDKP